MLNVLLLLIVVAIVILLVTKVPFGMILIGIGVLAVLVLGVFWVLFSRGAKDEGSPAIRRNFWPLNLLLRVVLAVVLYFFLCANHLIPEFLIYIPEFLAPILM